MIQTINGRLMFVHGCPKKEYNKRSGKIFRLSLLVMLLGIFLLPMPAYLSGITPEKLIELTNQERTGSGLNALTANQFLTKAAMMKGRAILENNIFSHTINNEKFSAWIKEAGYGYSYAGENLALDFITSEGVVAAWNNSPAHKKNLLNPYYQEIGVAVMEGKFQGRDTVLVVQEFGAPPVNSVQPLTADSALNNFNSSLIPPAEVPEENLLTRAALGPELNLLSSGKVPAPAANFPGAELNKIMIQSYNPATLADFILIFTYFILIYSLIYLFYYYFLKINKLIAA